MVKLELIRLKNKFQSRYLDPTHFRNAIANMSMQVGECTPVMVEFQLHHSSILQHNTDTHAHAHYEFFRSQMGSSYSRVGEVSSRGRFPC